MNLYFDISSENQFCRKYLLRPYYIQLKIWLLLKACSKAILLLSAVDSKIKTEQNNKSEVDYGGC